MITLPLWLLIIIGVFGLPILVGIIAITIMTIKAVILIFKEVINEI